MYNALHQNRTFLVEIETWRAADIFPENSPSKILLLKFSFYRVLCFILSCTTHYPVIDCTLFVFLKIVNAYLLRVELLSFSQDQKGKEVNPDHSELITF